MVNPPTREAHHGRERRSSTRALMVLGTASNVGKSLLVVALGRWLRRRGVNVAPFKAQNIALNSYVTPDGAEIGWAQAQQAFAAGVTPHADMNPVLLKPGADASVQVVVRGKVSPEVGRLPSDRRHSALRSIILESYRRCSTRHDVVLIEGSGSAAEVNLKARDVSNLWMARAVGAPCLLVADIDRGGVFASILGTLSLLTPSERRLIAGFVINKFHGDPLLFAEGVSFLEKRSGKPCLGVIPHLPDICLKAEDSVALGDEPPAAGAGGSEALTIGVVQLPHMANHTDFDPLTREPGVRLVYVTRPEQVAGLDLLILPGSKSTVADLDWLRQRGLADALARHGARGGRIFGICGGMQMLGQSIDDPHKVEDKAGVAVEGLGLLPVRTIMNAHKTTTQATAVLVDPRPGVGQLVGYEIHMGWTERTDPRCRPLLHLRRAGGGEAILDGAQTEDGRVFGTYLHGLLDNDAFRLHLLNTLRGEHGWPALPGVRSYLSGGYDAEIDRWTGHVMRHLDETYLSRMLLVGDEPPGMQRGGQA
ncbi:MULTISPECIES: cobyric acid synthase [Sorangium]|uniref:Cobyric acid synthase n=1 Tax=Sorangium cellulosum TaxID=56 RepID=A0A4P2R093_SORCE|nr:cobyric acid synthase [Sorangium sp. Soce836]AUX36317.1 cobyric acid synthase [Sorangium cellulosum]WCQ95616.1 Cobyric acid synthase [Sorangium sp. Soce836]